MMTVWPDSRLSLGGGTFDGPIPGHTPDTAVLVFLIAAGLLLILNYGRLMTAVSGSVACYRGPGRTLEVLGNKYVCNSIRTVFILLIPFYALAFCLTGLSRAGYWLTLLAIALAVLLRKGLYALLGWLTLHETALFNAERTGMALSVPMLLFSGVVLLVGTRFPEVPNELWWSLLGLFFGVYGFFMFLRGRAFFLQTGFSIFFWVLYICALEILPICVVVKILMNGY